MTICKVIKQDPTLYIQLNDCLLNLVTQARQSDSPPTYASQKYISMANLPVAIDKLLGCYSIELPKIIYQNPLLDLLVRSLFVFGSMLEPSISCETIKHVVDAITKIFGQFNELKKTVVDLI